MDYQMWANQAAPSQEELNRSFVDAKGRVYLWMTGGLVLTTLVALLVSTNEGLQQVVFSSRWIIFGLIGAQLGLILLLSAAINKLSPPLALRPTVVDSNPALRHTW